jgi:peptidoglycan/LPS O-acetylase OafA/YrhL
VKQADTAPTTATVAGVDTTRAGRAFDFPCFDGLRAIAVMSAMLEHIGFVSGAEFSHHEWFAPLIARLEIGPAIFFMISGFLLYRAFCAAAFAGRQPTGPRVFFRRRILRIFPAYWLALTATLLFGHATTVAVSANGGGFSAFTFPQLVSLYSLTQIYRASWFPAGMSQSWTLAVEITFYLMLPAYALLMRRLGAARDPDARLRIELAGVAGLYLVSVAWRAFVFYAGVMPLVSQHWLFGYLDVFGFGMALAAIHAWSTHTGRTLALCEWLGRHADFCFVVALGCYLVVALTLHLPRLIVEVSGGRAYARNILNGLVALFVLLPAVFGPQDRSWFRRFLRWQPVVYVGIVSYGVYLWHNDFLEQARIWSHYPVFAGNFAMLLVVTLAWSLAVASISYFFVEQPILRRKDQPLFRRRPRPRSGTVATSAP